MYVKVTVRPDTKKERILKESDSAFTISVKEKAERNLANRRVVEILADEFNVETNQVRIISGHRSAKKIISIE